MKSVILQEFVSVDGLASGPDGSVDFVPAANKGDQSFGKRQMEFLDSIDTILLGRVTYQMFAQHWPNVNSGEDKAFDRALVNRQSSIVNHSPPTLARRATHIVLEPVREPVAQTTETIDE
jgi:dihydrofolate reductase